MKWLHMNKIRSSMATITLVGGAMAIALLRTDLVTNLQALSVMLIFVAGSYLVGAVLVQRLDVRMKNHIIRTSNWSFSVMTLSGRALVPALISVALLTGILLLHSHQRTEENAWKQYVIDHDCRIVARYRHGYNNEQWLCSDGVTYFR